MDNGHREHRKTVRLTPFACLIVIISFAFATSAAAQDTGQVDLSAGYLNVMGTMHGVNIQVSGQLTRRLWLVGEFDAAQGPDCLGCEPTYRDFAGLGGFRFAWQPTPGVSPFAQFLAGGLHSTALGYEEALCCGLEGSDEDSYSYNYLAFQPGGGVTVMVTPRLGFRAQADLQFATPGEGMSIFPRFAVGAVFRLGRRP